MPGHFSRRAQAPDVSAHREFYARGGYTGDPDAPESVADDMTLYLSSMGFADGGPVDDFDNQYQSQYYAGGGAVRKTADRLYALLKRHGLDMERSGSGLSDSQYLNAQMWNNAAEQWSDPLKIRLSSHDAKPTYERLNGAADYEIGSYGTAHTSDPHDAAGMILKRLGIDPDKRLGAILQRQAAEREAEVARNAAFAAQTKERNAAAVADMQRIDAILTGRGHDRATMSGKDWRELRYKLRREEGAYDASPATSKPEEYAGGGKVAKLIRSLLGEGEKPVRAYHGSPHDFDAFDASKIGTGEGAQAYGHGLYFAEHPGTAEYYRHALTSHGQSVPLSPALKAALRAEDYLGFDTAGQAAAAMRKHPDWAKRWDVADQDALARAWREHVDQSASQLGGKMYEVGIHADPARFLDWDKMLHEQSPAVRGVLEARVDQAIRDEVVSGFRPGTVTGGDAYGASASVRPWSGGGPRTDLIDATNELRDAGIPGIRYLDQGSRDLGAGTHNYVIFPGMEDIIEILRKYAEGGSVDGDGA